MRARRRTPITVGVGGKKYRGSYAVYMGIVTVTGPDCATAAAELGDSEPQLVARRLLEQLVGDRLAPSGTGGTE